MTSYTAPLTEMRFVINDLVDLGAITALDGYEDATSDLVDAILDEAGKFGSEVLAPLNHSGDQQGCIFENGVVRTPDGFREAYAQFVEGGWNGLPFNPQYGGQGLPRLLSTAVSEIWNAANMSFGLCPLLTQGAVDLLSDHGTDWLKEQVLPKLVSGEWNGTMNLTEPQAGSDLAQVRTRAVKDGDYYRITGQKIFVTYGENDFTPNILHMVLARTPDAPPGIKGITLFAVPKFLIEEDGSPGSRNDVRCVSIEHKLGINASPTATLSYGDDGGAIGYLVGEENRGIEYMFIMMNNARLAVGLEGVAISERAYQQARDYARERTQGSLLGSPDKAGVTIVKHADVRRMLLSMKSQTEATRALAYFVAAQIDIALRHADAKIRKHSDALVNLLTPVAKAWSSDTAIEVASTGIQVHGGMGFIEETGAAQHLRDARITTIYEGTNGIQANDLVGRKVARENGETAKAFIATMRELDGELAASGDDGISPIRSLLRDGIDALEKATDWIIETYPENPQIVAAGAVHYTRLMGIVAGGWLMSRAALIAQKKLTAGEGDQTFLRGKIVSARFFADQFVAQSGTLASIFTQGSETLRDFEDDLL